MKNPASMTAPVSRRSVLAGALALLAAPAAVLGRPKPKLIPIVYGVVHETPVVDFARYEPRPLGRFLLERDLEHMRMVGEYRGDLLAPGEAEALARRALGL